MNIGKNRRVIFAWIFVGVVVVSGLAAGAFGLVRGIYYAPTLEMHGEFPTGFDEQEMALRTLTYDGQSRCTGIVGQLIGREKPWTHDFIQNTTGRPTATDMERLHPIDDERYQYVGGVPDPFYADSKKFEKIELNNLGGCEFEYWSQLWQSNVILRNVEPVDILDDAGVPFHQLTTPVVLGGNGDGQGGTRFMLEGSWNTTLPIHFEYRLFNGTGWTPAHQLHGNVATAAIKDDSEFMAIFDVPMLSQSEADLMIVPYVVDGGLTFAPGGEAFTVHRLMRLEPENIELKFGGNQSLMGSALDSTAHNDVVTVQGHDSGEAWAKANGLGLADSLEAISHASFLTQVAFEPRAPIGKVIHIQKATPHLLETRAVLELTEEAGHRVMESSYVLTVTKKETKFIIGLGSTPLRETVEQAARASATISQLGANGVKIMSNFAEGPTPEAAMGLAGRWLNSEGQFRELESITGKRIGATTIAVGAQSFFIASGLLDAAREIYLSDHATESATRITHQINAVRIAAETVFGLNLVGAVVIASAHLAWFLLEKYTPTTWIQDAGRWFQEYIFGVVPKQRAQEAWEIIEPQIVAYSAESNASIMEPYGYEVERRSTPMSFEVSLLAIALAALLGRRLKSTF